MSAVSRVIAGPGSRRHQQLQHWLLGTGHRRPILRRTVCAPTELPATPLHIMPTVFAEAMLRPPFCTLAAGGRAGGKVQHAGGQVLRLTFCTCY